MSVAVLENIPPILAVARAITTAFMELDTIARYRYRGQNCFKNVTGNDVQLACYPIPND